MISRARFVPLVVVWVCVLAWSVALTIQQPLFEPLPDVFIRTYGARDVRVALILLAALAAVWARRGDRRGCWWAIGGATGWLALDVLLDRANVTGGWFCAGLAVGAGALLAGVWSLAARAEPSPPRPGPLFVAATLSAAVAGCGYWINGAQDTPRPWPTLWPLLLAGVGVVVMVGCLLTTGQSRGRLFRAAGFGVLALLAVVAAVVALAWSSYRIPAVGAVVNWPFAQLWDFGLPLYLAVYIGVLSGGPMMVLLTVVAVLAWDASGWRGYLGTALGVFVGWAVFAILFMKLWVDLLVRYDEWLIGDWLTRLAGNPHGHDPQSYAPSVYFAVEIGVAMAGCLLLGRAAISRRSRRPIAG